LTTIDMFVIIISRTFDNIDAYKYVGGYYMKHSYEDYVPGSSP